VVAHFLKNRILNEGYIRHNNIVDDRRYCVWDCATRSQESGHGPHADKGEARRREFLACLFPSGPVLLLMNAVGGCVGAVESETVVSSVSELLDTIEKAPPGAVIVLEPGRWVACILLFCSGSAYLYL